MNSIMTSNINFWFDNSKIWGSSQKYDGKNLKCGKKFASLNKYMFITAIIGSKYEYQRIIISIRSFVSCFVYV